MINAISIKNLTKTYKDGKKALNNLSFSVKEGEIFCLLGPNGAGKSTLINILTTYLSPTSGEVQVLGYNLVQDRMKIRSQLACVAQKNSIDGYMTLYENMKFQGNLYGVKKPELENRIEELIQTFGLQEYKHKKVANCSGGIQRRMDIAMSMMSIPKILFLDEPTVGMDIESRQVMWQLIQTLNRKYRTTIFMTTHYLEEADKLSQSICIMKNGHQEIKGTPEELKCYTNLNLIRISFDGSDMKEMKQTHYRTVFEKEPYIKSIRYEKDSLILEVDDTKKDYKRINKIAMEKDLPYHCIEIIKPSLDDVFLAIAGRGGS